jgi:3-oxoacyl-[acyl-carrier protein] reductase
VSIEQEFAGRVAFITGAGSGFGTAFAHALCARGAAAAIIDIDLPAAERVAAQLRDAGHRAIAVQCDVADEGQVQSAVEATVAALGGIDILINNAGLHSEKYNKTFGALGGPAVRRLMDVNVMGVIYCSLACQKALAVSGSGCIVNISSIAGYMSTNAYGVSKLAVRGLTIGFAGEFAPDKIRVNAIAPGLMSTDVIRAELAPEMFTQFADNLQLIHRTGEVDDVVQAMLHLCSTRASFMTGETIKVAGGYPLSI